MSNEIEYKPLNIYEALGKVKKGLESVGKDQKATGFGAGYNFRGIDDVYNATHKLFGEYGIISTTTIDDTKEFQHKSNKGASGFRVVRNYTFKFFTFDGSYVQTQATGEAIDFGDKVYNKCHSIAHKYAIMTLLCIPTADMEDPDKTIQEPIQEEKKQSNKGSAKKPESKKQDTPVTVGQLTEVWSFAKSHGLKTDDVNALCGAVFKIDNVKKISSSQADYLTKALKNSSTEAVMKMIEGKNG